MCGILRVQHKSLSEQNINADILQSLVVLLRGRSRSKQKRAKHPLTNAGNATFCSPGYSFYEGEARLKKDRNSHGILRLMPGFATRAKPELTRKNRRLQDNAGIALPMRAKPKKERKKELKSLWITAGIASL